MVNPIQLRPYQDAAIAAASRALRTHRRVCLVAPTGSGKTLLASEIIRRMLAKARRALFLAHRKELLDQCHRKLVDFGVPESAMSVIIAGDRRLRMGAPIAIGSMQTVRGLRAAPDADVVFVDECHMIGAASYQGILARYPYARVIGLTATPVRGRRGLQGLFDDLVVVARPSELIAAGYILRPDIYTVPEELLPDIAKVKTLADGDYDPRQLAAACERWDLVGAIVDHYVWHGGGAAAIVFASSVAHSQMIAKSFRDRGIAAVHVDGTMAAADRQRALARFASGEVQVLCNYGLFVEGLDIPRAKVCVMARPTQSIVVYLQSIGRVVRPYGSETARVLDHAGNVQRFGFPDQDIEWSLGEPPRQRVSVKRCPQCWEANPSNARVCIDPHGECGPPPHEWTREDNERIERDLIAAEGRLARAVRDRPTDDPQKDAWVEYCREAIAREYSEAWAREQFRQRFGVWPPASAYVFPRRPQASWPDNRRLKKWESLRAAAYKVARTSDPHAWAREKYRTLFGEEVDALHARERAQVTGQAAEQKRDDGPQEEMEF